MTKRKGMTAAELMAQLNSDPEFLARQRALDQARSERLAELSRAEAPLVDELRKEGIDVQSAYDLVSRPDSRALPILLAHIQRPYPERVRESIARALAIPGAIEHWPTLLRLFETDPDPTSTGVKWALGCALAAAATDAAATDDVIEDVIRLLRDRRHGLSRVALVDVLASAASGKVLDELSSDPELAKEVQNVQKLVKRKGAKKKRARSTTKTSSGELAEASTSFDAPLVPAFLERLSAVVPGFGAEAIAEVESLLEELDVDEEGELCFEVQDEGRTAPLRLHIFMGDVDTPDLCFFTAPTLAARIDELMAAFFEEQGI